MRGRMKYAHLGVSELRRLRQIEEENTRLKRLVADRRTSRIADVVERAYGG